MKDREVLDIELFSFFSGLGLLDLGFESEGFNVSFVNEYDKRFMDAYCYARRNNSHEPRYGYSTDDIRKFLNDEIWEHRFPDYKKHKGRLIGFIGGPPCPDFSTAGKNDGKDGKNGKLTQVYIELIAKRKPDFFVLENVKGLYKTKKHRKFYDEIKDKLKDLGYKLFDSIENSLEYGVPQFRSRLFLVGFLGDSFESDLTCCIGGHKKYDIETILNMPWPKKSMFKEEGILTCPEGIQEDVTVEYWFRRNQVDNHQNGRDFFKVKAEKKFRIISEGEVAGKSFKRLHRWRYAPTSAYGNNEVHLHPYKMRRLSVAEALAIQSAPRDFILPQSLPLSVKFKMIGNGVPFLLSKGLAKDLIECIRKFAKWI